MHNGVLYLSSHPQGGRRRQAVAAIIVRALPAGNYNGSYNNFGNNANFWSSTEYDSTNAYFRYLSYTNAYVGRIGDYKNRAFSVRCVKD